MLTRMRCTSQTNGTVTTTVTAALILFIDPEKRSQGLSLTEGSRQLLGRVAGVRSRIEGRGVYKT